MSNYRPIAILPTMSKILEKCMVTRLTGYFSKLSVISNMQFEFSRGKSTSDIFLSLTEQIYSTLNNKKHSIGIFVDLKKTFDTVNNEILLKKLEMYGVGGNSIELACQLST